jgi:hypothetical protein
MTHREKKKKADRIYPAELRGTGTIYRIKTGFLFLVKAFQEKIRNQKQVA